MSNAWLTGGGATDARGGGNSPRRYDAVDECKAPHGAHITVDGVDDPATPSGCHAPAAAGDGRNTAAATVLATFKSVVGPAILFLPSGFSDAGYVARRLRCCCYSYYARVLILLLPLRRYNHDYAIAAPLHYCSQSHPYPHSLASPLRYLGAISTMLAAFLFFVFGISRLLEVWRHVQKDGRIPAAALRATLTVDGRADGELPTGRRAVALQRMVESGGYVASTRRLLLLLQLPCPRASTLHPLLLLLIRTY
jgi:hypothetical protein